MSKKRWNITEAMHYRADFSSTEDSFYKNRLKAMNYN
jgi:hypothetical protein